MFGAIDNPFEMVVLIVAIVMFASVIRSGASRRRKRGDGEPEVHQIASDETRALREEVKQLRERIQVLERITVEKENSLERQIEELRDR